MQGHSEHGTDAEPMDDTLREAIIAKPDLILDDPELMRALSDAQGFAAPDNVVDMRGMAMARLEQRLDRLEERHREVIAAAYENLAGTNQVHRAILQMLDPTDFQPFIAGLGGDLAKVLRVDAMRLILESKRADSAGSLQGVDHVLRIRPEGSVADYLSTQGKGGSGAQVTLRQIDSGSEDIYGAAKAGFIRSEACLALNFGPGTLPGLLVMGSEDPHRFAPSQGTDLLAFFAGVFERAMRRWLS